MSELRFKVVEEAIKRKAVCMPAPAERASEYFGMYVFNEDKMPAEKNIRGAVRNDEAR